MNENDLIFSEYTVEEMSELLENIETEDMPELAEKIKQECLREIDPQPQITVKEKPFKFGRVLKIASMAAALVLVIVGAVIAANELSVPKYEDTTTTTAAPVVQPDNFNPLFSAVSTGNEKLIESLITNSLLLSQDLIKFAIDFAGTISYETIRLIAEAVKEAFGTTGLDALLEKAILGDSQGVINELSKKDELLMTNYEKLAFFFSAAFCDIQALNEFLEKGFDATMKAPSGETVYEIAQKYGNEEIAEAVAE